MKKFRVGELAKSLGISDQAVRFYESIGLIQSTRNPQNGYREYTVRDSQILYQTLIFKAMGFSLDDIRKMLFLESTSQVTDHIRAKKMELEQQILHLQYLNEELDSYLAEVENIGKSHGMIVEEDLPFYAIYASTGHNELIKDGDLLLDAQKNVPFLRVAFTFDQQELKRRKMEYRYGVAIREKWGKKLFPDGELEPYRMVLKAPVYKRIIERKNDHFEKEMFAEMLKEIQTMGYRPAGSFYGIALMQSFRADGEGYFEFIVSLEKELAY